MSAVPQDPPEESTSGLKPIQRLISDDRLAKIVPATLAKTEMQYCSRFARDFIRSDYNFCAAKMAVSRNGKLQAISNEFRIADEWFKKAFAWIEYKGGRSVPVEWETITLEIKHNTSGRLVRLLSQYDLLFIKTLRALMGSTISAHHRQIALDAAEARIKQIPILCIPDVEHFSEDGTLSPDYRYDA